MELEGKEKEERRKTSVCLSVCLSVCFYEYNAACWRWLFVPLHTIYSSFYSIIDYSTYYRPPYFSLPCPAHDGSYIFTTLALFSL